MEQPKHRNDPGLCASCVHARVISGAHSDFWLCELSRTDSRFPRYPRLPVLRCSGYRRSGGDHGPVNPAVRR